jgi:hypothetical protein
MEAQVQRIFHFLLDKGENQITKKLQYHYNMLLKIKFWPPDDI